MTTRLMFLSSNKVIESTITLNFDEYLTPKPDITKIYTNLERGFKLNQHYRSYGIDTSKIQVIHDHVFLQKFSNKNIYDLHNWLRQQIMKLVAIDEADDDQILIQDCDTFSIEPYHYFVNGNPVSYVLYDEYHSKGYYNFVKKFTGKRRVTPHSFVTEFSPILKSEWLLLKERIETRFQTDWVSAMISTILSHVNSRPNKPTWFSEYELLGNWCQYLNPSRNMIPQYRLQLYECHFDNLRYEYQNANPVNCVCFIDKLNTKFSYNDIPSLIDIFKKT